MRGEMMGDKYDELVKRARVEYAEAAAAARAAAAAYSELVTELEAVKREGNELQERLKAFEAGRAAMSPDDFAAGLERERWLQGNARGLVIRGKAAKVEAETAAARVSHVIGAYRGQLGSMLAADIAEMKQARESALEAVLRG